MNKAVLNEIGLHMGCVGFFNLGLFKPTNGTRNDSFIIGLFSSIENDRK
jgi:hypothetical protein